MKAECTEFTVKLTADEVRLIADALHAEYMKEKGLAVLVNTPSQERPKHTEQAKVVRVLRNEMAGLVGIAYMGHDL